MAGVGRSLPATVAGGEGARQKVERLLGEAEVELGMERLFGREWFGEDGVWRYDVPVPGQDGEGGEEVTFEKVAEAHPVVVRWRWKVLELAAEVGLRVE